MSNRVRGWFTGISELSHRVKAECKYKAQDNYVVFQWTVVDFANFLNLQHHFFGRIPGIHQNSPKIQAFLINAIQ